MDDAEPAAGPGVQTHSSQACGLGEVDDSDQIVVIPAVAEEVRGQASCQPLGRWPKVCKSDGAPSASRRSLACPGLVRRGSPPRSSPRWPAPAQPGRAGHAGHLHGMLRSALSSPPGPAGRQPRRPERARGQRERRPSRAARTARPSAGGARHVRTPVRLPRSRRQPGRPQPAGAGPGRTRRSALPPKGDGRAAEPAPLLRREPGSGSRDRTRD